MTFQPEYYPFVERDPGLGTRGLAPLLPITLMGSISVATWGLLDTGAAVNVLPYQLGMELGASWERQSLLIPLSGALGAIEAKGIIIPTQVGNFPVVQLAFAWAKTDEIPILLGQTNFFLEFDVCFHRSRSSFELRPKLDSSSNPA